ncbi:MAG: hypothetical protein JO128_22705 [Alphaproteobacteria bacterium]|nr:hypothetical protein [Alphaproteobacteria bacterium]
MRILERIASFMAWAVLAVSGVVMLAIFFGPVVDVGLSLYLVWHRGFGLACDSRTLSEAMSPSKQWIARARLVSCGGMAGGQFADVVLVPNVLIPLAVRYTTVFDRNMNSETRQRGDRLTVHWVDAHSLELQGAPCPTCQSQGHHEPCEAKCKIPDNASGIVVSIKSVEN